MRSVSNVVEEFDAASINYIKEVQGTVLLVDDTAANIKYLGNCLTSIGCKVLVAMQAENALKIAEKKQIDLILLDVLMPETDGFELLSKLKALPATAAIPVILVSASQSAEKIWRGFGAGAADYLVKPISCQEITARVAEYLPTYTAIDAAGVSASLHGNWLLTLDTNFIIQARNQQQLKPWCFFHQALHNLGKPVFDDLDKNLQVVLSRRLESAANCRTVEFEYSSVWQNKPQSNVYTIVPEKLENGACKSYAIYTKQVKRPNFSNHASGSILAKVESLRGTTLSSPATIWDNTKNKIPAAQQLPNLFRQSYVFEQQKSYAGGDFYWTRQVNDLYIVALGDCTGQGVPATILSTLCKALLERIVVHQQITSPEKILSLLNAYLYEALPSAQGLAFNGVQFALLCYSKHKNLLEFSGARRSLCYAQSGRMKSLGGERNALGGLKLANYRKYLLPVEVGTQLFLYTDGITNQFGEVTNKKYLYKRLGKLLNKVAQLPFDMQREEIKTQVQAWKGSAEQTDDMLLLSIIV